MIRLIWNDLKLWATGLPHLWDGRPHGAHPALAQSIRYKPGWGPWTFLPLYLTTYMAATCCGYGIVSLSRAWWERGQGRGHYPFARFMTRLLNWLVPGKHGEGTGGWLWGTASRRNLYS